MKSEKSNWPGILLSTGALSLLVGWLTLPVLYGNAQRRKDCRMLVERGERGKGMIIACNFVGERPVGDAAAMPGYHSAVIEYKTFTGEIEQTKEYWPVLAGDVCEQGREITIFYHRENRWVRLASENRQEIRKVLQHKGSK